MLKPTITFILILFTVLSSASANHESPQGTNSIIFGALGSRDVYAFDIYTVPTTTVDSLTPSHELQLTDGESFNFNGHFPSSTSLLSLLPNQTLIRSSANQNSTSISVVYATERHGSPNIYFAQLQFDAPRTTRSRSALQFSPRVQFPLLKGSIVGASFKDRPSVVGDYLIYVSTHEDPHKPRASWAAVYSTQLKTASTRRLTPYGIADFSPAVSPSGVYTAVASYGERGWNGEVEVLSTDIYVFLTRDGTRRVKVVENGGWPTWVDDSTIYFHRKSKEDGWISVYRAILPSDHGLNSTDSVIVERVTPPGVHAFTPATSPGNHKFIAVATRRSHSDYRQIELFDLVKNQFNQLTQLIAPKANHFNPFISPDSTRVGYHRCRGASNGKQRSSRYMLENLKSPVPEISLFRIDGWFPSWSPNGDRIALSKFPKGIFVMNPDGSNRTRIFSGLAFPTIWDPVRPVVYSSTGPAFASSTTEVDIISINVDQGSYRRLTTNGNNNAFPAPSPDGKWIVFRSGISGHKNLYIMDAVKGEKGGLHRLTEGSWDDTMCDWSPDGEWIAFNSDRENPGSGSFDMFLIHPNGTGLRKLLQSGSGGRVNHPYFSPDGKSVVFTTDYAAISADPLSNQHMFQPYGEIYIMNLDGSGLKRLTHNSFEDGTPAWGPRYLKPKDLVWQKYGLGSQCSFKDAGWTWLNVTSKHNYGVESLPLVSSKIQCAA